jgi:hypothetical protein
LLNIKTIDTSNYLLFYLQKMNLFSLKHLEGAVGLEVAAQGLGNGGTGATPVLLAWVAAAQREGERD